MFPIKGQALTGPLMLDGDEGIAFEMLSDRAALDPQFELAVTLILPLVKTELKLTSMLVEPCPEIIKALAGVTHVYEVA